MEISQITMAIAVYGAILSTIVFGWSVFAYFSDKPKLKLKYSTAFIKFSDNSLKPVFSISISNPTKHRIKLNAVGILFKNHQAFNFVGLQDGLPKELLPGDDHMVYRDIEPIKKMIDEQGESKYICARDATGKD